MRIVMPLFEFINASGEESAFGDGTYSLRRLNPTTDLPAEDIPGLSRMDLEYIKRERWAIVADDPDLGKYREGVNRLLLSFKIHTLGRLFIKYRLCAENTSLSSVINEKMNYILADKSGREVTLEQLKQVNVGVRQAPGNGFHRERLEPDAQCDLLHVRGIFRCQPRIVHVHPSAIYGT